MQRLSPHTCSLFSVSKALRLLRRGLLWVFLPLAAFLALPSLLIAALWWWRASKTWDAQERWSGTWLLAVVCGCAYGGILWFGHPFPSLLQAVVFFHHTWSETMVALERLWGLHLLLAPACALLLEALRPLSRRVRLSSRRPVPPSRGFSGEGEARAVRALAPPTRFSLAPSPSSSAALSASSSAPILTNARTSTQRPPREPLREPLGEFLGGELYEWVDGSDLCFPLEEFMRHVVVLGEPGYGKTITLLRLASIAIRYGMQVVYLDLKGSMKTASQFVAVMHLLGVRRIKVYPQEPYDGWRGDPKTLYNRLMQMVETGTHPFYRKLTSSLVSLAVNAPGGPPGNSKDFLRRLDQNWLYRAYAGKTLEHAYARRKITKLVPHLDDLSLTFEGFFDGIAGALDGGFAFEDGDAVYIGLDGDAHKEQAALMGCYLLEDCAHYASYRKGSRHAFLILDEFGVLESTNATDLYERVREPGMSVCASAQSYEGLGPERKKVVAASSVKILHRCGDPEEIVKYAGEREVPAFSHLLEEDEEEVFQPVGGENTPKRRTAVRMQRQYAMPIEEVQQSGIGKIALITGGLGAWCQVYPLAIPADLLRAALAEISTPPVVSPPPSPSTVLEPEPTPPKKTGWKASSPSARPAQKQSPGKGRGKKESQVSQTSQVPTGAAVSKPVPVQPPPPNPGSAPPIPAETGRGNGQAGAPDLDGSSDDDDSPVEF
jgi:hypothetical protein